MQYNGTKLGQDLRFKNPNTQVLTEMKYPKNFSISVYKENIKKYIYIIKLWISKKIKEILEFEDETLTNMIINLIESSSDNKINPRSIQYQISGFLGVKTYIFMKLLWKILIKTQESFLEIKELPEELKGFQIEAEKHKKNMETRFKNRFDRNNFFININVNNNQPFMKINSIINTNVKINEEALIHEINNNNINKIIDNNRGINYNFDKNQKNKRNTNFCHCKSRSYSKSFSRSRSREREKYKNRNEENYDNKHKYINYPKYNNKETFFEEEKIKPIKRRKYSNSNNSSETIKLNKKVSKSISSSSSSIIEIQPKEIRNSKDENSYSSSFSKRSSNSYAKRNRSKSRSLSRYSNKKYRNKYIK